MLLRRHVTWENGIDGMGTGYAPRILGGEGCYSLLEVPLPLSTPPGAWSLDSERMMDELAHGALAVPWTYGGVPYTTGAWN